MMEYIVLFFYNRKEVWCGYDTEKKNSKRVLFAWKKPPKTRFLTSSSKQIIIIIKQTVSITKLVNLIMRAPSPLIFTLTGLLAVSSLFFCLSIKGMFAIYFCIILCLFQEKNRNEQHYFEVNV